MNMNLRFASLAAAALVGLAIATPAQALLLDPNVFVSDSTSNFSGDPNLITSNPVYVGMVESNHTADSPLLFILGIPDWTMSLGNPTVDSSACGGTCSLASPPGPYDLTANMAEMTSSNGNGPNGAYGLLGLTDTGSDNWTNWSGDVPTASSFELFAFEIPVALMSGSPISLTLGNVPKGSYGIAYSEGTNKAGNTVVYDTPFTTAGLVDTTNLCTGPFCGNQKIVPEPASLALLGTALMGLGLLRLRRRHRNP